MSRTADQEIRDSEESWRQIADSVIAGDAIRYSRGVAPPLSTLVDHLFRTEVEAEDMSGIGVLVPRPGNCSRSEAALESGGDVMEI